MVRSPSGFPENTATRAYRRARRAIAVQPIIFRPYLVAGHALYALLLAPAVLVGDSPALASAASIAGSPNLFIGSFLFVLGIANATAALRDGWYRYECVTSVATAAIMAAYCYAVAEAFVIADGTRGLLGFALVFILTANMWARALTLVWRWVSEAVPPRSSRAER